MDWSKGYKAKELKSAVFAIPDEANRLGAPMVLLTMNPIGMPRDPSGASNTPLNWPFCGV